jgi:hydroxymethylpyrimidine pyrophosphatase-like HAD family hydrolase
MAQSYRQIAPGLARQIRLVMTDVDGTITQGDDSLSSVVLEAVRHLEESGIMVGFVSGRALPRLESLALDLRISGPIIAENGGVAKLKANGELVNLGYSRAPALKDLEKLKRLFPDDIAEREDNKYRLVDVVFRSHAVEREELARHLELLDSGYILHLLQKGVSKGRTLAKLLRKIGNGKLSREEVMVFGDYSSDLSLFQLFPHSVFIPNPRLPPEQRQELQRAARYASDLPFGEGFAEVALHILDMRLTSNAGN